MAAHSKQDPNTALWSATRPALVPARGAARFTDFYKRFLFLLLLIGPWTVTLLAVYTAVAKAHASAHQGHLVIVSISVGLSAVVVCALPGLLMACISILVGSSVNPRAAFSPRETPTIDLEPEGPPSINNAAWLQVIDEVRRSWSYEAAQVDSLRWRFRSHGLVYGFLSSMAFSLPAILLARILVGDVANPPIAAPFAIAVGASAAVSFIRDLGRMLVRASQRDSSTQMLAWSSKRLLISLTAATLLVGVAIGASVGGALTSGFIGPVLCGAGVAFLGDRGTTAVSDRVAQLIGAKPSKSRPGDDIQQIDGVEDEVAERLSEEGIDSVHSLAFFSTPKLFFNTPYTLQRICDWQDQALLFARLGDRARLFRDQLFARGATDVLALASTFLGTMPAEQKQDMLKILGFSSLAQAEVLFQRLASDDLARRLVAYRTAMPSEVVSASDIGTVRREA